MKLSKNQLKQLIKEELDNILNEQRVDPIAPLGDRLEKALGERVDPVLCASAALRKMTKQLESVCPGIVVDEVWGQNWGTKEAPMYASFAIKVSRPAQ
jgi:hypothetical protein